MTPPLLAFIWVLAICAVNMVVGSMMMAVHFDWDENDEPCGDLYEWFYEHDPWMEVVWIELWPIVLLAYWIEQRKKSVNES
jgi:hypothetical protein